MINLPDFDVSSVTDPSLVLLSLVVSALSILVVETVVVCVEESVLEAPKTRYPFSFISFVADFSWTFSSSLLSAGSISFSVLADVSSSSS